MVPEAAIPAHRLLGIESMHEPEVGAVTSTRRRVVVVNDDQGVLDMYRDMLRELDYEPVAMATTGIVTEQIRAYEPDAVILDLQVGDEAGYGVSMAVQLRGDSRLAAIPIIVCTGNAAAIDGQHLMLRDIGVPMLLKPMTIETLGNLLSAPVRLSNRPVVGTQ